MLCAKKQAKRSFDKETIRNDMIISWFVCLWLVWLGDSWHENELPRVKSLLTHDIVLSSE